MAINRAFLRALVVGLILLGFARPSLAQEKGKRSDEVFQDPPTGAAAQVILGLGDLVLAKLIMPKSLAATDPRVAAVNRLRSDLSTAETSLQRANATLTEAEKAARIAELETSVTRLRALYADGENGNFETALNNAEERLANALQRRGIGNAEAKAARIAAAEAEVTRLRAAVVEAELAVARTAPQGGIIRNSIRGVRAIGSTILVLDALGRVYVWNVMDRNPTASPVATLTGSQINRFFPGVVPNQGVAPSTRDGFLDEFMKKGNHK